MKKNLKYKALANRYAKAVFELASEENLIGPVSEELTRFLDVFRKFPDMFLVLNDEEIGLSKRKRIVTEVAKAISLSPLVTNFIFLLLDKERIELFERITESFVEMKESFEKLSRVEASVADSASTHLFKNKVEKVLSLVLKKRVLCDVKVSPKIIGGAIIKIGDVSLDASVAGELKKMKEQLLREL